MFDIQNKKGKKLIINLIYFQYVLKMYLIILNVIN